MLEFFSRVSLDRVQPTVQWLFRICIVLLLSSLQFNFQSLEGRWGRASMLERGLQFVAGVPHNVPVPQFFSTPHLAVVLAYPFVICGSSDLTWNGLYYVLHTSGSASAPTIIRVKTALTLTLSLSWSTAFSEPGTWWLRRRCFFVTLLALLQVLCWHLKSIWRWFNNVKLGKLSIT